MISAMTAILPAEGPALRRTTGTGEHAKREWGMRQTSSHLDKALKVGFLWAVSAHPHADSHIQPAVARQTATNTRARRAGWRRTGRDTHGHGLRVGRRLGSLSVEQRGGEEGGPNKAQR